MKNIFKKEDRLTLEDAKERVKGAIFSAKKNKHLRLTSDKILFVKNRFNKMRKQLREESGNKEASALWNWFYGIR